jgi:hypothetical protein
MMHLVGFTIEIYYDARTYERQKYAGFCVQVKQTVKLSTEATQMNIYPCYVFLRHLQIDRFISGIYLFAVYLKNTVTIWDYRVSKGGVISRQFTDGMLKCAVMN